MTTYQDIRRQVEHLTPNEQLRLLEELAAMVRRRMLVKLLISKSTKPSLLHILTPSRLSNSMPSYGELAIAGSTRFINPSYSSATALAITDLAYHAFRRLLLVSSHVANSPQVDIDKRYGAF